MSTLALPRVGVPTPLADGIRDAAPVALAYVPFGLALGASLGATTMPAGIAWSSSPLLFGGAGQLVAVQLLSVGTASIVVVLSVAVVNARMLLYSAALSPSMVGWRPASRYAAAYLLADPVYVLADGRFQRNGKPDERVGYFFGMAASLWLAWQVLTGAGVLLGAAVRPSLHLERAAPLTFLLLLLPMLTNRTTRIAAAVGGLVAVIGAGLPLGLGLLVGAVAGVAAGSLAAPAERKEASDA